jgi:hypothetical protein
MTFGYLSGTALANDAAEAFREDSASSSPGRAS